jgi:hypothetical protein
VAHLGYDSGEKKPVAELGVNHVIIIKPNAGNLWLAVDGDGGDLLNNAATLTNSTTCLQ